ncbi:hypothetical protein KO507_16425 [Gilvimarinus agarilyticus]|uniref:hypothetical protein n=1 Tax=Gilvimarinus sp. 2_MG-2023 TaxID=3062666 RepID=UPI001C093283|nr:hypothetical protein [Gilvimarinus sp. 2_MG-2023]MBU2887353.1 hypothetical protein [Gilvimarinus agarilyticus]
MSKKLRQYIGATFAVVFFGNMIWSAYDNITLGRKRCEDQCLAKGGVDFVWVPETTKHWWQQQPVREVEAKCTCITAEEKQKNKERINSIRETIRELKRNN